MKKSFTFSAFSEISSLNIAQAIKEYNPLENRPILVCIGSDLVLGDSLGPLVGTMLKNKNISSFIYGTLNFPVTAKEIKYAKTYLKEMHPDSQIIAIDAAVGSLDDIGLIKVCPEGVKPGLGVQKDLDRIGDCSIIGIVCERSKENYKLFNLTRLNLVYKMAEVIANGLEQYLTEYYEKNVLKFPKATTV